MQLEDFQVWSGFWLIKRESQKVKAVLVYLNSDIVTLKYGRYEQDNPSFICT